MSRPGFIYLGQICKCGQDLYVGPDIQCKYEPDIPVDSISSHGPDPP